MDTGFNHDLAGALNLCSKRRKNPLGDCAVLASGSASFLARSAGCTAGRDRIS